MGVRLEYLLVSAIVVVSYLTMTTKLTEKNRQEPKVSKELEFTDTTFTEVTTQKQEGIAFASYGTRIAGVLSMDHVRYHNDQIERLLANHGTYEGKRIQLDGNVSVHQKPRYDYYTEQAVYDQAKEVLYVTLPFVAYIQKHVMHGQTLEYDMRHKEAYATHVDALLEIKEK